MNLKKFIIPILILLYSGCSSKEDFYRGAYNFIQDNSSCTNYQECKKKKIEQNRYSHYENQELSYDEYKNSVYPK